MSRTLLTTMTIASIALIASDAWAVKKPLVIKHVSKNSLEASCNAAGGSSWSSGGQYGCVKDNCDGKGGTCGVNCTAKQCLGVTPIVAPKGGTASGVLGTRPGATVALNPRPPRAPTTGQGFPNGSRAVNPTRISNPIQTSNPTQISKKPQNTSQSPQPQNVSGAERGPRSEGRGSSRR